MKVEIFHLSMVLYLVFNYSLFSEELSCSKENSEKQKWWGEPLWFSKEKKRWVDWIWMQIGNPFEILWKKDFKLD